MKIDIIGISESEHDLVVNAASKYGAVFVNTHDLVMFGRSFVVGIKPQAFAFTLFLSQFQKSIMLSFLSVLRHHEVQFNLMLRQALEATALGSYALHNPNVDDFGKPNADNCLIVNRNVTRKAYKWLESAYPKFSKRMKYMKDQINENYAHSSILPASDNVQYDLDSAGSLFFDKPDVLISKQHLWWIGDVVLGILNLFALEIKHHPIVEIVADFQKKMNAFRNENMRLKKELMEHPRFKRWIHS